MKKFFIRRDKTYILEKTKEAFSSVMPITVIILLLSFILTPINSNEFLPFVFGSVLVVFGIGLFTLGADIGMTPIGQYVGKTTLQSRKIGVILPVFFVVGTLITICEPDLQVLANDVGSAINKWVLLLSVGAGVGVYLIVAFFKTFLKVKLSYILIASYILIFILSIFVPKNFIPLSFDASGVTTGPMSVPFIIAIGTGMSAVRTDGQDPDEGFGLTALCSVGPILAVMILGIIFHPESIGEETSEIISVSDSNDLIYKLGDQTLHSMRSVGQALAPIVLFFVVFKFFGAKMPKAQIVRIFIGVLYTYVGMVLFLTGVDFGFSGIGSAIGRKLAELSYNWIVIPVGFIIGFFAVAAEPAVHVLVKQVYEITDGGIPKKVLLYSLMIGVGISVSLAFFRILLGINIYYFIIPVYSLALLFTFFVPNIFTAIAFDSGGVASGAMTASFVLPMALGICRAVGGNIATDGFGVIAMVAMTPLLTIQTLGIIYKSRVGKKKKSVAAQTETTKTSGREEIIE